MSHLNARTRIAICLLSGVVALAGCQDASGLVAPPDVKPSFDMDGMFVLDVDPEMMLEPFYFEPGGGNPQYAYVTYPNTEDVSPVAIAETFNQFLKVHLLCMESGGAWVKVLTGNGYWKVYSLLCV